MIVILNFLYEVKWSEVEITFTPEVQELNEVNELKCTEIDFIPEALLLQAQAWPMV